MEISEQSPLFLPSSPMYILFTNTSCYIGITYEIPAFFKNTLGRKKEELQWQLL